MERDGMNTGNLTYGEVVGDLKIIVMELQFARKYDQFRRHAKIHSHRLCPLDNGQWLFWPDDFSVSHQINVFVYRMATVHIMIKWMRGNCVAILLLLLQRALDKVYG